MYEIRIILQKITDDEEIENVQKHLSLQDVKLNYIISLLEMLKKP